VRHLRKLRPAGGSHPAGSAVGVGFAPAHHGELLQGVFEDRVGQLRRALVTLPLPGLGSRAVFHPSQHHWGIVGTPELTKIRRAAILTLRELSRAGPPERSAGLGPAKGGQIEITSDIPRGIGMGSSTSDVTATIRAVADYHGVTLSRETIGQLAVQAECASDSIMIDDRVVLFGHRDGEVLESLGYRLPPLLVVGCNTAPGTRVDTLRFQPADYDDDEIAAFRVLRAGLRRAVAIGDTTLLGRVATASARINQRFLPKPPLADLVALCHRLGGCGVQVAHSGTVAGLIFDPRRVDPATAVSRCLAGIQRLGLTVTGVIGADPVGRPATPPAPAPTPAPAPAPPPGRPPSPAPVPRVAA
jgi:uncharacterized protein involved in propanediol utilization